MSDSYDDSGDRSQFNTGALRDRPPGKGMYQLIPPIAISRWAKRCEIGHIKYGDGRNWEKGMPVSEFICSALRHLFQYEQGDDAEDHLGAALWNIGAAMQTETLKPNMQDYETRKNKNIFDK